MDVISNKILLNINKRDIILKVLQEHIPFFNIKKSRKNYKFQSFYFKNIIIV